MYMLLLTLFTEDVHISYCICYVILLILNVTQVCFGQVSTCGMITICFLVAMAMTLT